MTQNDIWTKRDQAIQVCVFMLTIATGIEVGGSTFDDIVNNPIWTASPQAAKSWTLPTGNFFTIFSPLMALLAIVTMIIGWRAKWSLKKWLLIATSTIILCFSSTIAYFVPELIALRGNTEVAIPEQDHIERLSRWQFFDKIRYFFICFAFVILLHCVGLSYQIREGLKQK